MTGRLVAGRELDQLVHSRVMGAEGEAPPYSTDIVAAWEVWRRLPRPKRLHVGGDRVHHCMCGGTEQGADGNFEPLIWEKADKMALVICLAALQNAERSGS